MDRTPNLASLVAGLLILSLGFWLLERWRPSLPGQRRTGIQTRTDIAYWFFTPLVTRFVTRLSLGLMFVLIAVWQGVTFEDLRQAWPFHAIHHSSRTVDWLSSVRLHPVNDVVSRIVQVLPLYWMGFHGGLLAAFVPFLTLYALLLHANVSWTYGPLRYAIASPAFHRWHHTSEDEGLDKNFAGLFPFIDLIFGTFYMPVDRQPQRFGILDNDVPEGLLGQLAYPFRSRERS